MQAPRLACGSAAREADGCGAESQAGHRRNPRGAIS